MRERRGCRSRASGRLLFVEAVAQIFVAEPGSRSPWTGSLVIAPR
jgi:hypothetical protein